MLLCYFIILFTVVSTAKANDPFEAISPGAVCFDASCKGTLNDDCPTKAKGVGLNPQNTLVFLFTRRNPDVPEQFHCGARLKSNTNFNPARKTEIFVHGWIDGVCRSAWMRECKDQLLVRGDYNVILIDWTWGNGPDCLDAVDNVPVVGEQIACVIMKLMEQTGTKLENFHIIGQSFGAQIGGFAGKAIFANLGRKLERITGMDPGAGPFVNMDNSEILNRADAKLVDIIHTNSGYSSNFFVNIGMARRVGHADFFPNGGKVQQACYKIMIEAFLKGDYLYGLFSLIPTFCYHLYSTQVYKVSINACDCQFVGVKCKSYKRFKEGKCSSCGRRGAKCAVMGMDFPKYHHETDDRNHSYYLDTTNDCPYCDNSAIKLGKFLCKKGKKHCFDPTSGSHLPEILTTKEEPVQDLSGNVDSALFQINPPLKTL